MSSAELLEYRDERLPKGEEPKIIETMKIGVQRMKRMLDRVLLPGTLEFRPQPADLFRVCAELVEVRASSTRCLAMASRPISL